MTDIILNILGSTTILEMSVLFFLFNICLIPAFPQKNDKGEYKKNVDGKVKKLSVFGLVIKAINHEKDNDILDEIKNVKEEIKNVEKHFDNKLLENNVSLRYEIDGVIKSFDSKLEIIQDTIERHKNESEHRTLKHRADDMYRNITRQVEKMHEGKVFNDNRLKGLYSDVLWYLDYCSKHDDYEDGICLTDCRIIQNEYFRRFGIPNEEDDKKGD